MIMHARTGGSFTMALFAALLVGPAASAQYQYPKNSATTFDEYKDYPQLRGQTQSLTAGKLPSWMTLDGELRSRTEDQTAISLLPGRGKFYELERIRGGMEIRPTSWLSTYVQFHDKPVKFFAGRQLLNFGNERIIGISDWTQTSRSFDGFDARIGDKNRLA